MVQKGFIFIFWLPKHALGWFPQCVALLWSCFILVTAGVRCCSEWVFRCIYGCQWVHFYKSRAPLKAACTTFIYFLVNVFIFWKDWPGCQNETEQHPPFVHSLVSCVPSAAGSRSWTSPTWQQLPSASKLRCKSLAPWIGVTASRLLTSPSPAFEPYPFQVVFLNRC